MKDPTTIGFDAASRPDAVRLKNFRLDRILGEGGMGVVWRGKQLSPVQRDVAVKIIKSNQFDSSMMVRFEAERQALALMEHPHIATFLDAGVSKDGVPFFAMELVDGQPITTFCDQYQLDVPQRLRLFLQVVSAVQHAHQKGVIHRDIKPSNVLVAGTQEAPIVKVIDFGLAKALQPEVHLTRKTFDTQTGQILGTVQYMSPEQVSNQLGNIDTRTDVFLLGILLYEILVGVTPLVGSQRSTGSSVASTMDIITKADFPPPSRCIAANKDVGITAQDRRTEPHRLAQILSQDLDWVVMKTLRQEQAERYPTVQALADDVQRYLNGDPVLARSPTLGYRWKKFAGKHWAQLAVSAALLASLVFGIIGTTFGLIKANSATREAIAKSIEAEQLRLEADQQKEEAEASLQKITALNQRNERVLQFISDSFRKPNPYVAAHDVKVVDILEQARYGVKSSGLIPAEEISVLASIANAYLGLGDYAATAEIYEEIDALFSEDDVLADDIFSVSFQIPWAESLMMLGKWDNAEAKIRRVTDQLRTQFPDADTMYAADANDVLGHIYQLRNQVEE
ncbi:MAG: serine/threonine protein kinase, partial [Planctomycetales bacterium]|nr:serine/threonine protein kinase [Planctomycetales bacterium]